MCRQNTIAINPVLGPFSRLCPVNERNFSTFYKVKIRTNSLIPSANGQNSLPPPLQSQKNSISFPATFITPTQENGWGRCIKATPHSVSARRCHVTDMRHMTFGDKSVPRTSKSSCNNEPIQSDTVPMFRHLCMAHAIMEIIKPIFVKLSVSNDLCAMKDIFHI